MKQDAYDRIVPVVDEFNGPYFAGLAEGSLMLQRCDRDGTFRYPAAPVCPRCLSPEATWVAASGRGTVWSWIVMHQRYFEAFADELPYNVTFVGLEEGPFLMSSVVNPERLRVGAPLRLQVQHEGRHHVPRFEVTD